MFFECEKNWLKFVSSASREIAFEMTERLKQLLDNYQKSNHS